MNPISTGWRGADEIRRGAAYTARLAPMRAGESVAFTAATVRVLDYAGAVIDSGAATVSANVGTYAIAPSTHADLDPATGWTIEWTCTFTGEPAAVMLSNPAELVLHGIQPVVAWSDLLARHPDLTERLATGDDEETAEDRAQAALDEVWSVVRTRLRGKGRRPVLVVDPFMFSEPHIFGTLAVLFRGLATAPDSAEWMLAADYDAKFEAYWSTATFEEADPSTWQRTGTQKSAKGSTWLGSTPHTRFRPLDGVPQGGRGWW